MSKQNAELVERILRKMHEFYQIGVFFSDGAMAGLLGDDSVTPVDLHATLLYIAECGYIRKHEGQSWEVLAFDKSTTCAVCGKYAPKYCPGCRARFCAEHYEAHVEDNFAAAERMLDKVNQWAKGEGK